MSETFGVFRDRSDSVFTSLMLFQTKWTECLHGAGSLRTCLMELSELFGAHVVHLHRTCTETGRQRTVATVDREAREGARPLTKAVGPAILASARSRARPGTVWTLGEVDDAADLCIDDRSARWLSNRGIREIAVIQLDRSGTEIDVLELYLPAAPSAQMRAHLSCVATAASAAWVRREKGRIARLLSATPAISEKLAQTMVPDGASPLSLLNPSGLTPTETRICGMFRSGASTGDISRQLRISDSTLRTHLRNIYAKTGVGGQVDLVRVLLREPDVARSG